MSVLGERKEEEEEHTSGLRHCSHLHVSEGHHWDYQTRHSAFCSTRRRRQHRWRFESKTAFHIPRRNHHHHQVPDLEQTLATMPLQTSLSSDNFKKIKPLLCPPVAELQRLSRNVIRCLPLSRLPSTLPVKDKNSKPLRLHTCPKNIYSYISCVLSLSLLRLSELYPSL